MNSMASVPLVEIFDFPSIKGLTAEFVMKNPGNVPVYGGKMTETPIGFIADNLPGVKYFSNCLAWNREGSIGYVFYHKGKFSTNDHQRPLLLRKKYEGIVNLEYARIVLQELLLSQGFVWSKTASKEKVKEMSIEFPIKTDGKFDTDKQHELVMRHLKIDSVQRSLNNYNDKLKQSTIIEDKYPKKTVFLSDECFTLSIGKRVIKKDLVDNGIPVFSANTSVPFGKIKESNNSDFDRPSLIWGIDGNFEWGYIPGNTVFANTDHCGRLQINDSNILSEFVYYQLRESSSSYGFNRTYRASLTNIGEVSVSIPIDDNGQYDKNVQSTIINKYKKIDNVKAQLRTLINHVISSNIEI